MTKFESFLKGLIIVKFDKENEGEIEEFYNLIEPYNPEFPKCRTWPTLRKYLFSEHSGPYYYITFDFFLAKSKMWITGGDSTHWTKEVIELSELLNELKNQTNNITEIEYLNVLIDR